MKSLGLGIALLLVGLLVNSAFNFFTNGDLDPQIQTEAFEAAFSTTHQTIIDSTDFASEISADIAALDPGHEGSSAIYQDTPKQKIKH